jgi:hypothetical protein
VQTEAVCAPAPAVEYEPAEQLVQVAEPASAYLPAVQVVHVEASVAPVAAEAVPAAQLRHTAALVALAPLVEYVPAGQGVHAELPVPAA